MVHCKRTLNYKHGYEPQLRVSADKVIKTKSNQNSLHLTFNLVCLAPARKPAFTRVRVDIPRGELTLLYRIAHPWPLQEG